MIKLILLWIILYIQLTNGKSILITERQGKYTTKLLFDEDKPSLPIVLLYYNSTTFIYYLSSVTETSTIKQSIDVTEIIVNPRGCSDYETSN